MESKMALQKLGLVAICSLFSFKVSAECTTDDRRAKAHKEMAYQNDRLGEDQALLNKLKTERMPWAELVQLSRTNIDKISRSETRSQENLEAISLAREAAQRIFDLLIENESARKALAANIEIVLHSRGNGIDPRALDSNPDLKMMVQPLLNPKLNQNELLLQILNLLLWAARSGDTSAIEQAKDNLTGYYEQIFRNAEVQKIDDADFRAQSESNLSSTSSKLAEFDKKIAEVEAAIVSRTKIRDANARIEALPECKMYGGLPRSKAAY